MTLSPKDSFETFLNQLVEDRWMSSFVWTHATSHSELKSQKKKLSEGWSRSHKASAEGEIWCVDIEALPGMSVGVDLELVTSRPILENPKWLAERFGMDPVSSTPQFLLEEWVSREAVFKACVPDNADLMLSSFYRVQPGVYGLVKQAQDSSRLLLETRLCLTSNWIMAVARRTKIK